MAEMLPAWDDIVTADAWKDLDDQQRRTVYQKYLTDIGQEPAWQGLKPEQKLIVTRKMEVDAGFWKPSPTRGEIVSEVGQEFAEKIGRIPSKIGAAISEIPSPELPEIIDPGLEAPRAARTGYNRPSTFIPFSEERRQPPKPPPPFEGAPVGDSYFVPEKQSVVNELGEQQEVGPGWVTPWSNLDPEARRQDVEEVLTGARNDFGGMSRYINQIYAEYRDYQKTADELKAMIDRGALPDFYMTVSDTPYEQQLEQFDRIKSSYGKLAEGFSATPEAVEREEDARKLSQAWPGEPDLQGQVEADLAKSLPPKDLLPPQIQRFAEEIPYLVSVGASQALRWLAPVLGQTWHEEGKPVGTERMQKVFDEAVEYWGKKRGPAELYAPDVGIEPTPGKWWIPRLERLPDVELREILAQTVGLGAAVAGPVRAAMTTGRLATEAALATARISPLWTLTYARPFFRSVLAGMVGGVLLGEGKLDESLQNAALFGLFEASGYLPRLPEAIRKSDIWRKYTIRERGLALQTLQDTITRSWTGFDHEGRPDPYWMKRGPLEEKEILKLWNSKNWQKEAIARRGRTPDQMTEEEFELQRQEILKAEPIITPEPEPELPRMVVTPEDIPHIRDLYRSGDLDTDVINEMKRQNPNLAFELDDLINERIIEETATTGQVPQEVMEDAKGIGAETETPSGEDVSGESEAARRLRLRNIEKDRVEAVTPEAPEVEEVVKGARVDLPELTIVGEDPDQRPYGLIVKPGPGIDLAELNKLNISGSEVRPVGDGKWVAIIKTEQGVSFRSPTLDSSDEAKNYAHNLWMGLGQYRPAKGEIKEPQTIAELQAALKELGAPTSGKKAELQERLKQTRALRTEPDPYKKVSHDLFAAEMARRELEEKPKTLLLPDRSPAPVVDAEGQKMQAVYDQGKKEGWDQVRALNAYEVRNEYLKHNPWSEHLQNELKRLRDEGYTEFRYVRVYPEETKLTYWLQARKTTAEAAAPPAKAPPVLEGVEEEIITEAPIAAEKPEIEKAMKEFPAVKSQKEVISALGDMYKAMIDQAQADKPDLISAKLAADIKDDIEKEKKYGYSIDEIHDTMQDLIGKWDLGDDLMTQAEDLYNKALEVKPDIELYPIAKIVAGDLVYGRSGQPIVQEHEEDNSEWYWEVTEADPWLPEGGIVQIGRQSYLAQEPRKQRIPAYVTRTGKKVKATESTLQDFTNLDTGETVTMDAPEVWERFRTREKKEPVGEQLPLRPEKELTPAEKVEPEKPVSKPLKEIQVEARAIREKTGEIIKVEKDAETALRDVDESTSIYQQLLECLKS